MEKKKNIFTIQFEKSELEKEIESQGGEMTEEQFETYTITEEEFKSKIESYCYYITKQKELNAPNEGLIKYHKEQAKRLEELNRVRNNDIERKKKVISEALKFFNIDKLEFSSFKLSFRKSKSVKVLDEALLLKDRNNYVKKLISLTDLKKRIESGAITSGAEIVEKKNIQIK